MVMTFQLHAPAVYPQGTVWTGKRIHWQLIPLWIMSTYTAISNLHISKIATAPAKPFPAFYVLTSRSLASDSKSGDSSASALTPLTVGHRFTS
jgi:hypothetical protein